jgi:hypothetical protein
MAKKVQKKLERLLRRLESETLTTNDRKALQVLLAGHIRLAEAVKNDDMKTAELLVGEIFDQAFPSSSHD